VQTKLSLPLTFAILTVGTLAPLSTQAQSAADFYKGKTVTMIVGGSAGGGFDTLARAIGRHIGNHIPGSPTIVVQNMPGAGGTRALDHLYNVADKDGSVIALANNTPAFVPLFTARPARYDAAKFSWLGTASVESPVVLLWHTVPVNSVKDLQTKQTTMGASGSNSAQAFYTRLLNATLHTKMKIVNGYRGQNDIYIAMERREIDGYPSVFYSSLTSTRPTWLPKHIAKAILQYGPERVKALGNVPWGPDLISNPADKQLFEIAISPNALGRPLLMPPGVPADRLAAMRKALAETFRDPAFKKEADKIGLLIDSPRSGEQLEKIIRAAYAAPADIIARIRKLQRPGGK
jgi:tripartite-type tricarboxylate transporter receptor subunit TctC